MMGTKQSRHEVLGSSAAATEPAEQNRAHMQQGQLHDPGLVAHHELLVASACVGLPELEVALQLALQEAAHADNYNQCVLLLSDPTCPARITPAALLAAICSGSHSTCQLLLLHPSLNLSPQDTLDIVQALVTRGWLELSNSYLSLPSTIHSGVTEQWLHACRNELTNAALEGDTQACEQLLVQLHTDDREKRAAACTQALLGAVQRNHTAVAALLVNHCEGEAYNQVHWQLLSSAAHQGMDDFCRLLLRKRNLLNQLDDGAAVYHATAAGHLTTVQLLLEHVPAAPDIILPPRPIVDPCTILPQYTFLHLHTFRRAPTTPPPATAPPAPTILPALAASLVLASRRQDASITRCLVDMCGPGRLGVPAFLALRKCLGAAYSQTLDPHHFTPADTAGVADAAALVQASTEGHLEVVGLLLGSSQYNLNDLTKALKGAAEGQHAGVVETVACAMKAQIL